MTDTSATATAVTVLEGIQTAFQKLKLGINEFEDDLQKLRNQALAGQGVQCQHGGKDPSGGPPISDDRSIKSGVYVAPDQKILEPMKAEKGSFWKDILGPELRQFCTEQAKAYKFECEDFVKELEHLEQHYKHVGGGISVRKASEILRSQVGVICEPMKALVERMSIQEMNESAKTVCDALQDMIKPIDVFRESLYEQKHAFYFRKVREWDDHSKRIYNECRTLQESGQLKDLVESIYKKFVPSSKKAMLDVADELRNFGEKALPKFLVDEKEKETTRYVDITTIATFFSSITASNLQLSISIGPSDLYNVVNLFWFVSLVFSVSSGVSSLLGMSWRKSSIYDTTHPPWLIKLWLEKAPMIFLVISALMFIVGLNLFAYLTSQAPSVTLSTNVFTGAHGFCLFVVASWFMYRHGLNREEMVAKRAEDLLSHWKKALGECISPLYESDFSRHYQRNFYFALGSDKRVFQLNWTIQRSSKWPSSPNKLARVIRSTGQTVKSLFRRWKWCKTTASTDANIAKGERPVEVVVAEYRQKLQDTFGDSERIDGVMDIIDHWVNNDDSNDSDVLHKQVQPFLWGYPRLSEILRSDLTITRNEYIEARLTNKDAVPTNANVGKKSLPPPPPSHPPPPPPPPAPTTTKWAHAKAEEVNPEFLKEGPDWYALFNPSVAEHSLDVNLARTLRHNSDVHCVQFSADGVYFAVGCKDGTAYVHETNTDAEACILREDCFRETIYSVCFSPNIAFLATAGKDNRIKVWNIKNKSVQHSFEGHQDRIDVLEFSKDGNSIVSCSRNGSARIWKLETGTSATVLRFGDAVKENIRALSIAISHDGEIIAVGYSDHVIRIWDVKTGHLVERLTGHKASVKSVAFTPDDKGVISGGDDSKVKHWDIIPFLEHESRVEPLPSTTPPAPEPIYNPDLRVTINPFPHGFGERGSICKQTFAGHKNAVQSVATSTDGRWLVTGSKDESVLFWNAHTAQLQFALHGHNYKVPSVDVSPNGGIFASCGGSETRIWKYENI